MKSEQCLDLTKNTTMKLDLLTKQDIASDGKPLVNSIIFFIFLFLALFIFYYHEKYVSSLRLMKAYYVIRISISAFAHEFFFN